MQSFRVFGFVVGLAFASLLGAQETALPDVSKGEGFAKIVPPQPTQDTSKVEVIEFFWYGCPHCYAFEPYLTEWEQNLPDHVQLIRQPAIFSSKWAPGARAYFIAEALGISDQVHAALFDAIQKQRNPLDSEDKLREFFVAHGVAPDDFKEAYDSFIVATRMRQAESMPARYGVTGVPAIIINGKYRSNGTLAKSYPGLIAVMNALIEQEFRGLAHP